MGHISTLSRSVLGLDMMWLVAISAARNDGENGVGYWSEKECVFHRTMSPISCSYSSIPNFVSFAVDSSSFLSWDNISLPQKMSLLCLCLNAMRWKREGAKGKENRYLSGWWRNPYRASCYANGKLRYLTPRSADPSDFFLRTPLHISLWAPYFPLVNLVANAWLSKILHRSFCIPSVVGEEVRDQKLCAQKVSRFIITESDVYPKARICTAQLQPHFCR